ncbi:MAG: 3-deoxy-8-phosphooctulonate synthase [Acidobacteriota bacterium]
MSRPRHGVELAPGFVVGNRRSHLPVIAGPCVIESDTLVHEVAETLRRVASRLDVQLLFKASLDKANRSSADSFRGLGFEEALAILAEVKIATGLPVTTDVHEPRQCDRVAEVVDVLQIPAFLCRQTDLLRAAGRTGCGVTIKKGQFMAPDDMRRAADKVRETGNERIAIIERGFSFGYHNLVVDMRSFPTMADDGLVTIHDATHSLQLPGGGKQTGGTRRFAEPLARAAIAAGADGVFLEVHPRPEEALSDATTQLRPARAEALLDSLVRLRAALPTEDASA